MMMIHFLFNKVMMMIIQCRKCFSCQRKRKCGRIQFEQIQT
ncbi:unnamed protein product [Paramecium sonneborni]|uniref:Uncharacterized protein n=1 Tax=Paramecium sonneborni TaxID=65129 RepID=A0A8S1LQ86_9CILI|nr:unnamed protein product [Paramecium sonneborni]